MKQEFLKAYDRNVDAIFRYCYRATSDRSVAKNLTEKVFEKLWADHNHYESLTDVDTNLRAIAMRLIRQHKEKELQSSGFQFA